MRKGIMALEGLKEEEVVLHQPDQLIENDLIEMNECAQRGIELEDSLQEGSEVARSFESICVKLEQFPAGASLSPPVAAALHAALEHFDKRIGNTGPHAVPAFESFGQPGGVAVESILDSVKAGVSDLWQAIVRAFMRVTEWVTEFFDKWRLGAKKLNKRAEAIREKARTSGGYSLDQKIPKSKAANFMRHLLVDGEVVEGKVFEKNFTDFLDESAVEIFALQQGTGDIVKGMEKVRNILKTNTTLDAVLKVITQGMTSVGKTLENSIDDYKLSANKDYVFPENTRLMEHKLQFSSLSKYVVRPQAGLEIEATLTALTHFKMFIGPSTGAEAAGPKASTSGNTGVSVYNPSQSKGDGATDTYSNAWAATEINCLDPKLISSIASAISTNMKNNIRNEQASVQLKNNKKFLDRWTQVLKVLGHGNPAYALVIRLMGSLSKLVGSYAGVFLTTNLKYEASMCKFTLDYCDASLASSS